MLFIITTYVLLYLVNFICALIKRESKVVVDKVKNSENSADIERLAHIQINFIWELTEKVELKFRQLIENLELNSGELLGQ